MLRLLLSLALLLGFLSAADAADGTADARTVAFIESFVAVPVDQIPPDRVNDFMLVKLDTLPSKLKEKALARKFELVVLKELASKNAGGMSRSVMERCSINDDVKSDDAKLLKAAGFVEVTEEEETQVETDTGCGQRELMCEFTLQILLKKDKKGKTTGKRYFLHASDPVMAFVSALKSGEPANFGYGLKPRCSR
jgi:hypothetical protein